ncbi:HyaD/HybD family hydrogenase maturation endopeptidase [Parabacteroides provencensis]|uniref:HyaD/HybD family hydrogenase maturation endopeptidase n=1 Tax=Parabacteroides provencensis TaxID=1944636 RepID=UPI000C15F424|nr:HyaD/HybD family hydrogenase maturation endopeptidase [Parabacteroides provencensis]
MNETNHHQRNTLILGVGNLLLKDEGVGIHTIRALEKETLPSHVRLMDGGTGGLHLLSWLDGYDPIIMIDATLDNNPPGTVRLIRPRFATDFPPLMSAHEIGLRDMIEAMILTGKLPEIHLIVISVGSINEVNMELTPEVEAAIPYVVQTVKGLVCHSRLPYPSP